MGPPEGATDAQGRDAGRDPAAEGTRKFKQSFVEAFAAWAERHGKQQLGWKSSPGARTIESAALNGPSPRTRSE
jgi:hypothetical protein